MAENTVVGSRVLGVVGVLLQLDLLVYDVLQVDEGLRPVLSVWPPESPHVARRDAPFAVAVIYRCLLLQLYHLSKEALQVTLRRHLRCHESHDLALLLLQLGHYCRHLHARYRNRSRRQSVVCARPHPCCRLVNRLVDENLEPREFCSVANKLLVQLQKLAASQRQL